MRKSTKKFLMKSTAALMAVCLSPIAAVYAKHKFSNVILQNSDFLIPVVNLSQDYTETPLAVNDISSGLIMYSPGESGAVVTAPLPSVTETETKTEKTPDTQQTVTSITEITTATETAAATSNTDVLPPNDSAGNIISKNISDEKEDLRGYESEYGKKVYEQYFGVRTGDDYINLLKGGQIYNRTDLSSDEVKEIYSSPHKISLENNGEPEVLIIHTHATESYMPENTSVSDDYNFRSLDPENGVVSVGTEIAKSLAKNGITVIHDGTLHDYPNYKGSYTRSEETVTRLLQEYPSIKIVLDVHRDGIEKEDKSPVAPVAVIDGKKAAQIMIISAADDGNWGVPNFRENLRFAAALQESMEYNYKGLTRPILFDYCQYNQHLSTGSLLIEVGAQGNTISEAKFAGKLFGEALAKEFTEKFE